VGQKAQSPMAKSLFITYDGLTDPLGQSQILPYLTRLAELGHSISILSCEKEERLARNGGIIREICQDHHIKWTALKFHTRPPVIAKYYDLYRLTTSAFRLNEKEHFDIIHCRSYLAASIGMKLKKKFGVRYLFDMRGFWVDERVDGHLWDTHSFFYRNAYKKWKKKEADLIRQADHIISLTEAAKKEITTWESYTSVPISVIPCSADMELFNVTDAQQKRKAREILQIDEEAFVLSYLGSLGTWYLLDKMLILFKAIKQKTARANFLILTPEGPEKIYGMLSGLALDKEDFVIRYAQRKDVPTLIKASDVGVSFIKPAYSKIASSPTKLGELLSMGIPVVCNEIGDVRKIISMTNGGVVLNDFNAASFDAAADYALSLRGASQQIKREAVQEYYSLQKAVTRYDDIYHSLAG
jgi:glycosyltransferase involved in cell wall biosynthesis